MNILHLSTHDIGGAAIGALRVHNNLKSAGFNSVLLVNYKSSDNLSDVVLYKHQLSFFQKVFRYVSTFWKIQITKKLTSDPDYVFFNKNENLQNASAEQILKYVNFRPDIIIIYWVSNFINTKTIYELNQLANAPILWYLMDSSPMTGGCHYSWDCKRFQTTCGKCPALYSTKLNDASFKNLEFKKKYISKSDVTILTGTSLAIEQAKSSALFCDKPIRKMLLGLNSDIYKPIEKSIAKKVFSLPTEKKVIFFGATYLQEKRKGGKELIEALAILHKFLIEDEKQNVVLLIAGKNFASFENISFEKKYLGFIQDERMLALAYQAADIFVCPSIEDAGPMMVIESLACGTPVVAFDLGFAHDFVNSQTGYLAQKGNAKDLSEGLLSLLKLSKDQHLKMSAHCASVALSVNSEEKQISTLTGIFRELKN